VGGRSPSGRKKREYGDGGIYWDKINKCYVGSISLGNSSVMSQDIEDTANPRKGRGVFFGQPDGLPVAW
jgi:hypothetical protein